jgi:hypothetical protein
MTTPLLQLRWGDQTELTLRGKLQVPVSGTPVATSIELESSQPLKALTHDGTVVDSNGTARIVCAPFLFEQTPYELELVRPAGSGDNCRLLLGGHDLLEGRRRVGGTAWVLPLNFGSEIGYTRIELWDHDRLVGCVRLEVFPSKLDYHADFLQLRADLQLEVHALVHALGGKTFRTWKRKRGGTPPGELEWLVQFETLLGDFARAVERVAREPRRRFVTREEWVDPSRARRATAQTHRRLQRQGMRWEPHVRGLMTASGARMLPNRIPDARRCLDLRTPENLFVAHVCERLHARVRSLLLRLPRADTAGSAQRWIDTLGKADGVLRRLRQLPLFAELGAVRVAPLPTLALHLTPGYREVHEIWLDLHAVLEVGGGPFELAEKDVATLYELWCFVALGNLLRKELKMQVRTASWLRVERQRVEVRLRKGQSSMLEFHGEGVTVRVIYNREERSPTGSSYPDNTVEIEQRGGRSGRVFRYVFDAKYRLSSDADYVGRYGAPGPPVDSINRMHAYRDQIVDEPASEGRGNMTAGDLVWDMGYRRWVQQTVAAVVLFPYAGADADRNQFFQAIPRVGVGSLPFLPQRRGEVEAFLRRIAAATDETVEDTAVELSSAEERQRIAWAHEYGLLAIVPTAEQLDFIRKDRIYHMPYVDARGLRLRADFVVLLLSEGKFGSQAGARLTARVRSVHFGLRGEIKPSPPPSKRHGPETRMIWFQLGPLEESRVRSYDGHPPQFGFTTRLAWEEAADVADVLLVREPERRMVRELRQAGWTVRVREDRPIGGKNFDLASLRLVIIAEFAHAPNLLPGMIRTEVRFNPDTAIFYWVGGEAPWSELMLNPEAVLKRIRQSLPEG